MMFTGDPSFFAFNGEENAEPEDSEAPPVERFRELHRLSYTVRVMLSMLALNPLTASYLTAAALLRIEN